MKMSRIRLSLRGAERRGNLIDLILPVGRQRLLRPDKSGLAMTKRHQIGQTLIEVLLALAMAVVIVVAIVSVVIIALDNAQFSKNHNLANAYAQEGMEVLREIRDRSWTEFSGLFPTQHRCLAQNSKTVVSRVGPNCVGEGDIFAGGTHFIRYISLVGNPPPPRCRPAGPPPPPPDRTREATVEVRWSDGKCPACAPGPNCPTGNEFCHQARLVSCFARPPVLQTP